MSLLDEPTVFTEAIEALMQKGIAPDYDVGDWRKIDDAVKKQGFWSAGNYYEDSLKELKKGVLGLIMPSDAPGEGESMASIRLRMKEVFDKLGYDPEKGWQDLSSDGRINLVVETNRDMAYGAGQFIQGNDQDVVDAFPAWELYRLESRIVPRGEEIVHGVEQVQNSWEERWQAACDEAGDDDALDSFNESGRMVALKSSDVWDSLGSGSGVYDDTLDNPFPPFAFNSGMWVRDVSFDEAVELNLIENGEKPEPNDLSILDMFANERQGVSLDSFLLARACFSNISVTEINRAANKADRNPSDAQVAANNFRHGHLMIHGLDVSIENQKGSIRKGKTEGGKEWQAKLAGHYGYVIGVQKGKDGDHVDVFIGDSPDSEKVFIIDQVDPHTGKFDEHKCLVAYPDRQTAIQAYLGSYSDNAALRMGNVTEMPVDQFKAWLENGETMKPMSLMPPQLANARGENLVGHKGRPGLVGGSAAVAANAPKQLRKAILSHDLVAIKMGPGKKWKITETGKLAPKHIQEAGIPKPYTDKDGKEGGWKHVYANLDPKSFRHAIGINSLGNTMSRNNKELTEKNKSVKFSGVDELMKKSNKVVDENESDSQSKDPKIKEPADALKTIISTGARPGGETQQGAKFKTYGITTLEGRHVVEKDDGVHLIYVGKSTGEKPSKNDFLIQEKGVGRMLMQRKKDAGDDGRVFDVRSDQLLAYSKKLDGGGFLTKDFRTLKGTVSAIRYMRDTNMQRATDEKDFKKKTMEVGAHVGGILQHKDKGSTALQSYIDPHVFNHIQPLKKGQLKNTVTEIANIAAGGESDSDIAQNYQWENPPKRVDWRNEPEPFDPDDELLAETPPDVIDVLGFDPLEFATEEELKNAIHAPEDSEFSNVGQGRGNWGHSDVPGIRGGSSKGPELKLEKIEHGDRVRINGISGFGEPVTVEGIDGDKLNIVDVDGLGKRQNFIVKRKDVETEQETKDRVTADSVVAPVVVRSIERAGYLKGQNAQMSVGEAKKHVSETLAQETGFKDYTTSAAVHQWSTSSNDTLYGSLLMQKAAENSVGAKMSSWQNERFKDVTDMRKKAMKNALTINQTHVTPFENIEPATAYVKNLSAEKSLKSSEKFIGAMYSKTQTQLKDAGIDHLVLYRGVALPAEKIKDVKVGDRVKLNMNALESWTSHKSVAYSFAGGADNPGERNVVIKAVVPRESIVSNASTGFGCLNEREFVVHNGKQFPVMVYDIGKVNKA